MRQFLIRRILQFPLMLVAIYLLTFVLVWVAPGSPFVSERNIDPAKLKQLKEQFHADTWYGFLTYYPYRIITSGDFGPSMHSRGYSVGELISERIGVSMRLGFASLVVAVAVGVCVGTLSAVYRNGVIDYLGVTLTLVGISVPSFVTAAVLLLLFVAKLEWFSIGSGELSSVSEYVLPTIALSLIPMAYIVRLQRVAMLDVLGADYVRTARAKGLSKPRVIIKHCLRNAFMPVFSYLGPAAAFALTGSFVIETVFDIQGLGKEFISSVTNRDQTLILALVMIYGALVLGMNLIVDIGYVFLDPRIDVSAKGNA